MSISSIILLAVGCFMAQTVNAVEGKDPHEFQTSLLAQKLDRFDFGTYEKVVDLTNRLIANQKTRANTIEYDPSEDWIQIAIDRDFPRSPHINAQWFYYSLLARVEKQDYNSARFLRPVYDKLTGAKGLDLDKFKEVFEKYAMKPCRAFVKTFGPDVFEPVLAGSYKIDQEGELDFKENMVRYKLCRNLIQKKDALLDLCLEQATMGVWLVSPANRRREWIV